MNEIDPHEFTPFTTRDGSVACSKCYAAKENPIHSTYTERRFVAGEYFNSFIGAFPCVIDKPNGTCALLPIGLGVTDVTQVADDLEKHRVLVGMFTWRKYEGGES